MVALTMRVRGLDPLRAKLGVNSSLLKPWAAAIGEAGDLLLDIARGRAPKGATGKLHAQLTKTLDPRPVPRFVKVGYPKGAMPVSRGKRTFRYPGALEGSARYHYRSGPHAGKTTKGWLSGSLKAGQRKIGAFLRKAGAAIEQEWTR